MLSNEKEEEKEEDGNFSYTCQLTSLKRWRELCTEKFNDKNKS